MKTSKILSATLWALAAAWGIETVGQSPTPTPSASLQKVHYGPNRFDGEPRPAPFETILGTGYEYEPLWLLGNEDGIPEPDSFDSLVSDIHIDTFESDGFSMNRYGEYVLFEGNPTAVAEVAATAGAIAKHFTRGIRVTLRVHSVDTAKVAGVGASAEELSACAGDLVWSQETVVRPGAIVQCGRATTRFIVQNASGELAQESSIIRPETSRFETGIHIGMEVHPVLKNDGFALFLQCAFSREVMRRSKISTGMQSVPNLERPEVVATSATIAGLVKNGGRLAFLSSGDPMRGENLLLTIEAAWADPVQFDNRVVSVIPIGALTTEALRRSGHLRFDHSEDEPNAIVPFIPMEDESSLDSSALHDLVYRQFESDFDNETLSMQEMGSWLIVRGDLDRRGEVTDCIRNLESEFLQGGVLDWNETATDRDPSPANRTVLPVMTDRKAFLIRRHETRMLNGWDAMVAQDSHILVPVINPLTRGSMLSSITRCTGPGSWNTSLHLELVDGPEPKATGLEWTHGGIIETTPLTTQRLDSSSRAGTPQELRYSAAAPNEQQFKSTWAVHLTDQGTKSTDR